MKETICDTGLNLDINLYLVFLLRHTSLPKKVVKKYVGKRWSNQSAIDAVRTIYYRIINKQQTNF